MTGRSVNDLAADVREVLLLPVSPRLEAAHAALAELVSRLETAEAQVAALTQERDEQEGYPGIAHDFLQWQRRAEAAEAALAEANERIDVLTGEVVEWKIEAEVITITKSTGQRR